MWYRHNEETDQRYQRQYERGNYTLDELNFKIGKLESWKQYLTKRTSVAELEAEWEGEQDDDWESTKSFLYDELKQEDELWKFEMTDWRHTVWRGIAIIRNEKVFQTLPYSNPEDRNVSVTIEGEVR